MFFLSYCIFLRHLTCLLFLLFSCCVPCRVVSVVLLGFFRAWCGSFGVLILQMYYSADWYFLLCCWYCFWCLMGPVCCVVFFLWLSSVIMRVQTCPPWPPLSLHTHFFLPPVPYYPYESQATHVQPSAPSFDARMYLSPWSCFFVFLCVGCLYCLCAYVCVWTCWCVCVYVLCLLMCLRLLCVPRYVFAHVFRVFVCVCTCLYFGQNTSNSVTFMS